ncbi:molybdopterin-synthase adenylyltransferase MoeB [Vibrio coralliilyticus OCN008]|uniref:HesA/MoeB/ThiF family protein n=1 Tax=Vibrio coralliilyticus TaxID=190893 RepID=UPI000390F3ED|nr:ThiF family adenylyltransferase [Vibrio coralliilyticus]ERB63637.1 molybdopterin biosynthesis protein MoeB [Vibrio coralliilyticus OCN008]QIJ83555.1 molybdopterin-synthase adenylyltransferase MoeB [Vibrio coralliilyticus OCN008]
MLSDQDFLRYQRQISLPEIGECGQEKIIQSHVLIIGCGGLGSAASLYLAAAGVGRMVLVDDDVVDTSNLQRQIVYREDNLGAAKAEAMRRQLNQLNAGVQIRTIGKRLEASQLALEVMLADVVLDCTDNIQTRQLINLVCYQQSRPLVSAAAIGWQGQFAVFDYSLSKESGCYRCLYPFEELSQPSKCSENGILGPVVGTLGNYQALATLQKLALGHFDFPVGQLHLFNGLKLNWQVITIARDQQCTVCS